MSAASPDEDLPLVRALQAGDQNALEELIRRYQEALFRFIYRYTGDEETARDLLQETFVRLYLNVGRFKPRAKFSTWLHTIASNLCRDYVRSRKFRESRMTRSLDVLDKGNGPTELEPTVTTTARDLIVSREEVAAVDRAIGELPHQLKSAVILFCLEKRSQQECAELLGISVKAVETRVYRARKILAKKLGYS